MKKKLIAIAIAAAVAAPLTAQAAVTISGDAEFKMTHQEATNFTTPQTYGGWSGSNRVRVKVDADMGDVSVHTRFRTTTGYDNSQGDPTTDTTALTVDTDYSYMTVKAGPAMLTMGDQLATWGTKYFIEGARKDNRLKAGFKISNELSAGIMLDPKADENADGIPAFTLNAVYKMSNMMSAGIMHGLGYTKYSGVAGGTEVDSWTDVFVTGSMSGINFGVEMKTNAGTDTDQDGTGRYLMVGTKAGGMDVELHLANHGTAATGRTQDADWIPLGAINGDANVAGSKEKTNLLTVGMKAGGMDVTVGAGTAGNDGTTESVVGVDLGTNFGPADFNFSYGSYDSNSAYGFSFKTKF